MRSKIILGTLAVGSVFASVAFAQMSDFLLKTQLKDFFDGRVVDSRTQDGIDVTYHFNADGTFRAFFNRPKNPHWSPGNWWVTDENAMCFRNDKNETFCNKYRRDGEKLVRHAMDGNPVRGKWELRAQ
jgi:hypothetical protein